MDHSNDENYLMPGFVFPARYNDAMYSAQLLDHFERPRNAGEIAVPDATVQIENPACGDILKLTLRIAGDRIAEAKFLAKGCVPTIACASALTELLCGKTVAQARNVSREDIIAAIGGLPTTSTHASHLAMDALRSALQQLSVQDQAPRPTPSGQ